MGKIIKREKQNFVVGMFTALGSTDPYPALLVHALEQEGISLKLVDSLSRAWLKANQGKIDIIHFQWMISLYKSTNMLKECKNVLAFIYFLSLMKRYKYKIVWTVHNIIPHEGRVFSHYYIGNFFLTRYADALIVHSEDTKKEIKKYYGRTKEIFVIPVTNYQDHNSKYDYTYSKKKAREELGLPQDKFIYLYFGYVRKYKGVDIAIRAFQRAQPNNSLFIIAGGYWTNKDKESTEALISGDPHILSFPQELPAEKLYQYIIASDVIVLPYRRVTSSGAMVLALTFGKPIIGMRKGVLNDWVSEKNGIPIETEEELEKAFCDIQDKNLDALSKASYAFSQTWSWQKIAKLYREVYERILSSKSRKNE